MTTDSISDALNAFRAAVGADHVRTGDALAPYLQAACGSRRQVLCALRPAATAEVQAVVQAARRFKIPLYPFSCGRNWGMGSRLPVRDGAALVDLGRMNRIREVHVRRRYAVIEPGVTQRQLFEFLRDERLPLMINVTGSGADTSLLGNALDRGVGYFAERVSSLSGLEVVLGTGEVLRTGFGHIAGAQSTHLYRHGIGPDLGALFAQSNFGIVTAAGFDLMPQPEAHVAVIAKIAREDLFPAFIDRLSELRRRGVVNTVFHVGNKERSEITLAPLLAGHLRAAGLGNRPDLRAYTEEILRREGFGPWSAVGGLLGTPAQLRLARREVRRALRGIARPMFLTDPLVRAADRALRSLSFLEWARIQRALLHAVLPLYEVTKGVPTDAPLKSVYWPLGEEAPPDPMNPDEGVCGILYALPILPAEGAPAAEAMRTTRRVFQRYGFAPCITVNFMDDRSLETVITLAVRRDQADRLEAAQACIHCLEDELTAQGWPPYRVGLASMPRVVRADDVFWQTARAVKHAIDPDGIIAPGRYNLD